MHNYERHAGRTLWDSEVRYRAAAGVTADEQVAVQQGDIVEFRYTYAPNLKPFRVLVADSTWGIALEGERVRRNVDLVDGVVERKLGKFGTNDAGELLKAYIDRFLYSPWQSKAEGATVVLSRSDMKDLAVTIVQRLATIFQDKTLPCEIEVGDVIEEAEFEPWNNSTSLAKILGRGEEKYLQSVKSTADLISDFRSYAETLDVYGLSLIKQAKALVVKFDKGLTLTAAFAKVARFEGVVRDVYFGLGTFVRAKPNLTIRDLARDMSAFHKAVDGVYGACRHFCSLRSGKRLEEHQSHARPALLKAMETLVAFEKDLKDDVKKINAQMRKLEKGAKTAYDYDRSAAREWIG